MFDDKSIKMEVIKYFQSTYSTKDGGCIDKKLQVIQQFPRFFEQGDSATIGRPVSTGEIFSALKRFKRDKSPDPYGWNVDFYLHFF